jgi:hypothetical protein
MHYVHFFTSCNAYYQIIPEITMKGLSSLIFIGAICILLFSCGIASATASLTKLTIQRNSSVKVENQTIPASSKTITDHGTIQKFYNAAESLPPFTGNYKLSCGTVSIDYQIKRDAGTTLVHTMDVRSMGCTFIQIDNELYQHAANTTFIQLFQHTFGLTSIHRQTS